MDILINGTYCLHIYGLIRYFDLVMQVFGFDSWWIILDIIYHGHGNCKMNAKNLIPARIAHCYYW